MSALQFGWITPMVGPPESDFLPLAIYQERHILPTAMEHFDSLWACDHFYGFQRPTDPFLEGWTTLTWLAAKFPKVQLGHHVLGLGYRNPALTAKMAATFQTLSGGRFILGIGAGWRGEEYRYYGYDFPRAAVRIAQLDEAIQLMRRMWTEEAASFAGTYFTIETAYAPPRPEPTPPVLIGGKGEQLMLPLIGRQADLWNVSDSGGLEAYRRRRDIVHRSAEEAGRDPASIVLTVTHEAPLPQTSEESKQWVEKLQAWSAEGVGHFLLDFGHVTATEPVMRFVEEVMTPLRRA